MHQLIIGFIVVAGLTATAMAQVKPETAAFLREVGIDPDSPTVLAIANDKVGDETLDTLAADRAKRDVKKFIATRNYLRDFHKTGTTDFPPDYDADDLTPEEQTVVGKAVADRYFGKDFFKK